MDEHQAGEHEHAGRADVAQLLPQLTGVAADDVRDGVAQRRHHDHQRGEHDHAGERGQRARRPERSCTER